MFIRIINLAVFLLLCFLMGLLFRDVAMLQRQTNNNERTLVVGLANLQSDVLALQTQIDRLDKMAIKKNDYNAQSCLTIKPDGSQYIPIVITDEPMKQKLLLEGELQPWDKRTKYLDIRPLMRDIKEKE